MYAPAEQKLFFCSEKTVIKLGILITAIAVFSGQNMSISAYETGTVLKGYVQENTILKEQNDALFLLQNKWNESIKKKYGKNYIKKLDNGIIYTSMIKTVNSRKVKINISEINRKLNPEIEIIPQLSSNNLHSKSKIRNIAIQNKAILAVNGTYFKQNTGTPLGTLVIDKEIITGPIYERVGLGIGDNGFSTARIAFNGRLKNKNKEIKIDNINQPRMLFSQVLIYTNKWGVKSPVTNKPSKHLAIKENKIIAMSDYPLIIPEGGYVISMPKEKAQGFKLGDKVSVNYELTPNLENVNHIISGGPYLLKSGEIYIDTKNEKLTAITGRNPRTAIGYTKDNVMIIVTVDGRKEGFSGVTLNELAKIMKDLGCWEAINLDGGSSTVMYVNGSTISGSNIKGSAMISNALTVRKKV